MRRRNVSLGFVGTGCAVSGSLSSHKRDTLHGIPFCLYFAENVLGNKSDTARRVPTHITYNKKRDRCTKIVRPSRLWSERMMFRFDDDYSPSRNFASATTSAALKLPS